MIFPAGLGGQDLSVAELVDLLHLFGKQDSVSRGGASLRAEWFKAEPWFEAVQCEERGYAGSLRHLTIACKLGRRKPFRPVVLQVGYVRAEVLF